MSDLGSNAAGTAYYPSLCLSVGRELMEMK